MPYPPTTVSLSCS
uniref:Uncharacterized protein n=1 Tax=Moniliophthora roreri TaxID=221103 RepID=A0A0W0FG95_MONRR